MPISKGYKANFETLTKAGKQKDLALMECKDIKTGKPVYVVCAVYRDKEGQFNFVPLAKMFDGNPYEEVEPPTPEED